MGNYILKDGKIIEEPDIRKWGRWFQDNNNSIENTVVEGIKISTVFLGIDHSFEDDTEPILFETMIFGGEHDQYQRRYSDIEQAKIGHQKVIELVKNSL